MTDFTVAVSSDVVEEAFADIVEDFSADFGGDSGSGVVQLHYEVAFHFRNDTAVKPRITLNDDNTLSVSNLKVLWDKLDVTIGIDLPTWTIGGFCIIPDLVHKGGCNLRAPTVTLFGANPDITLPPLKLDGFINSEITINTSVATAHVTNANRTSGESDYDAHVNQHANEWQLKIHPRHVNVLPIEIDDSVAAVFKAEFSQALNSLPAPVRDMILAIFGGVEWLIEHILGIVGEISDWLVQQLSVPHGLLDAIETKIIDHFEEKFTRTLTEDPRLLMKPDPAKSLGPLMLPIAALSLTINSHEIVAEGKVG
ncbi:MAG TPA: hypothetical protein VII83_00760 [Gaiellaceae bacterium]